MAEKEFRVSEHIVLKLEDTTGICTVIIKKNDDNRELNESIGGVVLDEVIGVTGVWVGGALFAEKILFPDIPLNKELKKQKEEEYVVFLGDTHFGSKVFMKEEFNKFIIWIQGKLVNEEQKRIAEKTKYLILTGDIVEGVGIYPGQQEDLEILDIKQQYDEAARLLKQIPENIKIIQIPTSIMQLL